MRRVAAATAAVIGAGALCGIASADGIDPAEVRGEVAFCTHFSRFADGFIVGTDAEAVVRSRETFAKAGIEGVPEIRTELSGPDAGLRALDAALPLSVPEDDPR